MAEHGGGVIRELLASFGFEVDTHELKKGETALGSFVERAKRVAEGLAAAFAVEKIYEWAEGQVKAATQVERTAAALGISTQKVQELQYASKALGMDGDALLNMMGKLEVNQFKASQGTKAAAEAFSLLGVHVKDAHGKLKPVDELLPDIAEGIKKTKDPAKAAAIATELFGRSGRELLPFLKEGREGVEKYAEEFKALGRGFSGEAIEHAKEFEHQSAKMTLALKSLSSTIMQALLPMLMPMVQTIARGVGAFRKLAEGSEVVRAAMVVLGAAATAFAIQMAVANAPILLAAAAIAFLVLLVDDLINMFEGNGSLIGETLDKLFGKGASADLVNDIKAAWYGVRDGVKAAAESLREYLSSLDKVKTIFEHIPQIMAIKAIANKAVSIATDNNLAQLGPRAQGGPEWHNPVFGPSLPPGMIRLPSAAGSATASTTVKEGDVHFHVAGDLSNEVHERAAKQWHEHRKRERRETAATLQRAPAVTDGR